MPCLSCPLTFLAVVPHSNLQICLVWQLVNWPLVPAEKSLLTKSILLTSETKAQLPTS